jgi:hypothetical protein
MLVCSTFSSSIGRLLDSAEFIFNSDDELNRLSAQLAISEQYTSLRGALGLIAGALLLYRSSRRSDFSYVIAMVQETERRAKASLEILADHRELATSARFADACIAAASLTGTAAKMVRESLLVNGGGLEQAELAYRPIKEAYAFLAGASGEHDGCSMVSFSSCCCGQAVVGQAELSR